MSSPLPSAPVTHLGAVATSEAETMGVPQGAIHATAVRLRVPSVLRCMLVILIAKLSLHMGGFAWTIGWIRKHLGAIPEVVPPDWDALKATEYAVAMAGAFYPGRALCLEQSLALYWVLRRQGVAVTYCHGIQAHPFAAHAWIEYRSAVLNDVVEHTTHFTRLPAQLP